MGYPLALSSDSARLELVLLRFKEKHGRVGPTEVSKNALSSCCDKFFVVEDFCGEGLDS